MMQPLINRSKEAATLVAAVFAASLGACPALAAEEQTVDAFATWQGQGVIYETGENMGTFVGSIGGPFFIDTGKGPVAAGRIVCPAMLEINTLNARQSGSGKCTITADDGERTFAEWSCKGVHLIGCDGKLTLTGGTGRLAGISGSGDLSVRSTVRGIATTSAAEGAATEFAGGILVLHQVTYVLPDQ